jgi:ribonucleoside-diphosphate reductase alpha chain
MTRNAEIPFAKSLVDYIFRWLAMEFVAGYRAKNAPKRESPPEASTESPARKGGNGHGPRMEPDSARPFAYSEEEIESRAANVPAEAPPGSNLRLAIVADPLSQLSSELQADAPACDVCGSITIRSGTCYKCLNCGNSMGCS